MGDAGLIPPVTDVSQDPPNLPPLEILLVEDNKFNVDLALAIFKKDNHKVTVAHDGIQALEKLTKQRYDVILMDVQLPNLSGIEATKLIRMCESGTVSTAGPYGNLLNRMKDTISGTCSAIIAMTAHAMSDDRRSCLEAGMDDYVTKPFQPDELYRVIALATGKSFISKRLEDQPRIDQEEQQCEIINMSIVRQQFSDKYGLSADKVDRMLETLKATLTEEIAKAESALSVGDLASLSAAAHCIKGALLNLGLDCWAELARRLETQQVRTKQDIASSLKEQLSVLRKGLTTLL